jgi:hypothetical protein
MVPTSGGDPNANRVQFPISAPAGVDPAAFHRFLRGGGLGYFDGGFWLVFHFGGWLRFMGYELVEC